MPSRELPSFSGAVEGYLDEAVLSRVAAIAGVPVGPVHGRRGKAQLLASLRGYNNAARYAPWVVLVDLDQDCDCAPDCASQWLPSAAAHMCFRIVVRAIEAWLLSDRERIAAFLGISVSLVPPRPDALDNPKRTVVDLARRSRRRSVRDDLVPRPGSGRSVGPLYAVRMIEFVRDLDGGWRPDVAAAHSDSLARTVRRLSERGEAVRQGQP